MDYAKHYRLLIEKARSTLHSADTYLERHHIVPKCVDGSDDLDNLVDLLPEQHFVAHLLLVKMHPDNQKLLYAAHCMIRCAPNQKRSNKNYAWLRKRYADSLRGVPRPNELMKRLAELNRGRPRTAEAIAKHRALMTGRKKNAKTKAKIAASHRGKKKTAEHRRNLGIAHTGRVPWNKGRRYSRVVYPRECPHCDHLAQDKYHYDYHVHYYHKRRFQRARKTELIVYPRRCPLCDYIADSLGKYHYHKATHHKETIAQRN